MKFSQHARNRMGQRGIPDSMVEQALDEGRIAGDRYVLDRRELRRQLAQVTAQRAALLRLLDKGGVAVAIKDGTVVTVMNVTDGRNRV